MDDIVRPEREAGMPDQMEKENRQPRIEAQRLKGFRDLMPTAMFVRRHVMDTLRSIFELHGFAPLETPALEYAATLEGKYGEDERLMYKFEDLGKRRVGMRFDFTVPLARVVAMHLNELQFPWKRYQMGPVWRGENPQFGRYREFYQCDIDIVGSSSPLADAEILSILGEAMTKLGFTGYRVLLNNRKLLAGMARSAGVRASSTVPESRPSAVKLLTRPCSSNRWRISLPILSSTSARSPPVER